MSQGCYYSREPRVAGPPPEYNGRTGGQAYPKPLDQQQQSNVNVVTTQPYQLPQVSVVQPRPSSSPPATLIFSVVLALVMGVQLFIPAFFCLIPSVIFAVVAYAKSDSKEERHTVKTLNGVSLCFSFSALIFYVSVVFMTLVGLLSGYSTVYAFGGYY